ncbi:MAG: hypothetical protein JWO97_3399 [Acidobacteria bacterium]|nr:hypothetical protein [Acidobacteriota bacterium]
MTRSPFAPTLVVGIGGSGVAIVREMKRRISARETVSPPVVYLAFDLDGTNDSPALQGDGQDIARADADLGENDRSGSYLAEDELLIFSAKAVATCVGNLDRTESSAEDSGTTFPFSMIREWFPIVEGRELRRAQLKASGAGQFRPVGRVGFFLNDAKILGAIRKAKTKLEQLRAAAPNGDQTLIYLISSAVGGTGAGMLIDVAANLSKHLPDYPILATLLLPELYDKLDSTENIIPNAYAALWEIAYLKNQHIFFQAQYPVIPSIDANDGVLPFQRVYLFGGWVGDREPFAQPRDAYPYVADLLTLHMSRAVRNDLISYQANMSGDAGRLLSDPASTYVFGSVAAMGIRLMSFDDLARRLVFGFADEVAKADEVGPEQPDEIMSIFEVDSAADSGAWIENLQTEAAAYVTQARLEATLRSLFEPYDSRNPLRPSLPDTTSLAEQVDDLLGTPRNIAVPAILASVIRDTAARAAAELDAADAHHLFPGSRIEYLRSLQRVLPPAQERPQFQPIREVEDLRHWSRNAPFAWILTRPRTPEKVRDAERGARRHIAETAAQYATWARSAAADEIRRLIETRIARDDAQWRELTRFCETVVSQYSLQVRPEPIASGEELYLDSRRTPDAVDKPPGWKEAEALKENLRRLTATERTAFRQEFGRGLKTAVAEFGALTEAMRRKRVDDWVVSVAAMLRTRFGRTNADQEPFNLLHPGAFFSDSRIIEAVKRCATPLFQDGRVVPSIQRQTARVLVPPQFAGHEEFKRKLLSICNGAFKIPIQEIDPAGALDTDRIVVVVENLFRAGEEIHGIYDYQREYLRRKNRALFHADRRWIPFLGSFVTKAGHHTRVACGNDGCTKDLLGVPEGVLICPGCKNPIRNRCGNTGCTAVDLATRPGLKQFIERKQCPDCGGILRSYWWTCKLHGDVPADKPTCPRCVASGRPLEPFSWRTDFRERFVCPSCVNEKRAEPFETIGSVAQWLTHGVNGQDVPRARKFVRESLTPEGNCPVCGTPMMTYCPLTEETAGGKRHFVHRDPSAGRHEPYRCYHHVDEAFATCAVCYFPALPNDAVCRRCHTELRTCRFCTPLFHLLVPASSEPEARCLNCTTFPDDLVGSRRLVDKENDLFCSNIYGCPAGARLYDATFPSGTRMCPICADTRLPLLEVQTRSAQVALCAFCTRLFARHIVPTAPLSGAATHRSCCLCGQSIDAVESLKKNAIAFDQGLTCAQALLTSGSESETFRTLYQAFARAGTLAAAKIVQQFFERIVSPPVSTVVRPRIEAFLNHWREQFGCGGTTDFSSPTPSTDETPQGNDPVNGALDLEFALSHENDIGGWIRHLKNGGVPKEALDNLGASLKDQTALPIIKRRIDNMIHAARELWDSIYEGT